MESSAPAVDEDEQRFRDVLAVNLVAPFILARTAARDMLERGEGGSIMNISSILGLGGVGRIWVQTGANMSGYFNQPETTAETLLPGNWLRTGDGAYRDDDGYFFLQDRIKDMIISGGENVYPAEVENVLSEHPAVSEVAVIGVPHPKWGETVKAVVVQRAGTTTSGDELIQFSRSRLAHYKCPTSVELVESLPRSATEKVLKNVLREMYS